MTATIDDVKNLDADDAPARTLSENTKVRIGFVLGLAVYLVATSWWASDITSKLNMVVSSQRENQHSNNQDLAAIKVRLENQESRIVKLEIGGSPTAQELSKQLNALQRTLDLHTVNDRNKP